MSERAFVICFCLFTIWFLFIREDWRTAQCKKNKEKYGKWMTDSEYEWYLKEKRLKKIEKKLPKKKIEEILKELFENVRDIKYSGRRIKFLNDDFKGVSYFDFPLDESESTIAFGTKSRKVTHNSIFDTLGFDLGLIEGNNIHIDQELTSKLDEIKKFEFIRKWLKEAQSQMQERLNELLRQSQLRLIQEQEYGANSPSLPSPTIEPGYGFNGVWGCIRGHTMTSRFNPGKCPFCSRNMFPKT